MEAGGAQAASRMPHPSVIDRSKRTLPTLKVLSASKTDNAKDLRL